MLPIEIDHVLICTQPGAPEAEALIELGLTEGLRNTHPGQGTANRRSFFRNVMLELLWVHDAVEAQSEIALPTLLWERCTRRDLEVSPFGIGFHPLAGFETGTIYAPFPTWKYRPPYLQSDQAIEIGEPTLLVEPMWFYMSFGMRPEAWPKDRQQPMTHRAGLEYLTSLTVSIPHGPPLTPAALAAEQSGCLKITREKTHALLMEFDHGRQGKHHDCRPALPLVLKW